MNIRKIISKQLMNEGRLEDAKAFVIKDYVDALIPLGLRNGNRMPEWFNELVDGDPSGNQKYLMWELKQLKRINKQLHPYSINSGLIDLLITSVLMFHELQGKLTKENIQKIIKWNPIDNANEFTIINDTNSVNIKFRYPIEKLNIILNSPKDINSYYDVHLLYEVVSAIKSIPTKEDIKKESIKLVDNEYWTVITPLTYRSSCIYGANTRWCTTAKEGPTQFNRYQSKTSSIFYFIPNMELIDGKDYYIEFDKVEYDISKIALHIDIDSDLTFYDAADDEVDFYIINDIIKIAYGFEAADVFVSGVKRAIDWHKEKLDKNL